MKKFAPMVSAFLSIPPPTFQEYLYLLANFFSTWGKKWPFSFKMPQFLLFMGGFHKFCTYDELVFVGHISVANFKYASF